MKKIISFPFLLILLTTSACTTKNLKNSSTSPYSIKASYQVSADDPLVGTYTSSWDGFRTNSYWIETPEGLIAVDTQFLPSTTEQFINWAESLTGKKFILALVLHPNPDKFNGTSVFQKKGIRVITSDQVKAKIPAVHQLRTKWFYDRFKPDYPVQTPTPDTFGNKDTEITVGGIQLKFYLFDKGCSDSHVVVQYKDHLFVGDLVTQGFHSWLELGYLQDWIKNLEKISELEPSFVHTGRGGSGDGDLIEREIKYLKDVVGVFKKYKKSKSQNLTPAISHKIQNEIFEKYPAYDFPAFVETGIEDSWKNLK